MSSVWASCDGMGDFGDISWKTESSVLSHQSHSPLGPIHFDGGCHYVTPRSVLLPSPNPVDRW